MQDKEVQTPQQTPPTINSTALLFCYEIGNHRILIDQAIKIEILEQDTVYPIPKGPERFYGVTSLRGDILPVANLHHLLVCPEKKLKQHLLKLEHTDFPALVIAIDSLPYQSDTEELNNNKKTNNTEYPQWVTALTKLNNITYLFVDYPALFKALQHAEPISVSRLSASPLK